MPESTQHSQSSQPSLAARRAVTILAMLGLVLVVALTWRYWAGPRWLPTASPAQHWIVVGVLGSFVALLTLDAWHGRDKLKRA